MKPQEALEAIEAIRGTVPEAERSELDTMLVGSLGEAATNGATSEEVQVAAEPSETTGESTEQEAEPATEPQTSIFDTLTPEQQERARAKQVAFAEHFSTKERPLSAEDFGLVAVGEGDERQVMVMLTTGNGLYEGSYNNIMSKKRDKDFTVKVGRKNIDTRKTTTWEVYQAFINQAKANNVNPLPDSGQLEETNDQPWTGTWLTGDPTVGFDACFGLVRDGKPGRYWYARRNGWNGLRVRPAAVV